MMADDSGWTEVRAEELVVPAPGHAPLKPARRQGQAAGSACSSTATSAPLLPLLEAAELRRDLEDAHRRFNGVPIFVFDGELVIDGSQAVPTFLHAREAVGAVLPSYPSFTVRIDE